MNLALFDFDGTITTNNTWTPFFRFSLHPTRMAIGRLVLLPVIVGHRMGVIPPARGRELANWVAFAGASATRLRQQGVKYATEVLPATTRHLALERIAWHEAQGDDVVVVSASLNVYLGPWCEARGLPYICTTLKERNGRITGQCVHGDCSGAEKARRIRERFELSQYTVVYAYGDTPDDREMLEIAHRKYYRWREVASWDEVKEYDDPPISGSNDAESEAG